MKRLILGRHAKAESFSESGNDFDRPLAKKGIDFASLQGEKLLEKNFTVDYIVSSEALRAKQTANIYREKTGVLSKIQFETFIYDHYTTQEFIDSLGSLPNKINTVMVIGHNPTIATMAARLVNNFYTPVKTGTIIIIDFDVRKWSDIEVAKGKLVEFF